MKSEQDIRRMLDGMVADDDPLTHEDYADQGFRRALVWVLSLQESE